MKSYLGSALALWLTLLSSSLGYAQSARGVIAVSEANRFGLQRMWMSQVALDVGRGELLYLNQKVSSRDTTTFFEVVHDTAKFVFGERDLDLFGRAIGKDAAQKLAQVKMTELQNRNVAAKLVTQTVPRVTLYAVTDAGIVQAIDGETGRTLWTTAVGTARYPTVAAAANDDFVATVNGSDIYLMKASTGEIVWQRKTTGAPGAGPALSEYLVFVPMLSGIVEAYPLDDPNKPPSFAHSHGRALLQPVFTGTHVVWPTDRGHVYLSSGIQNKVTYRLEANATIGAACSVKPPNQIVASSTDGFVYCIHEYSGAIQWRFSAGEPILTSPMPFGDTVYAVTSDKTLFAIDGALGQERWSTSPVSLVIGASSTRLYCIDNLQQLEILDRATGTRLGRVSTQYADFPFINKQTDRIIIGTTSGLLQCFRELQHEYPLLHIPTSTSQQVTAATAAPAAKTAPPPPAAFPFGEPAGDAPAGIPADPFGGDKNQDNPPEEKKPAEDPFGG